MFLVTISMASKTTVILTFLFLALPFSSTACSKEDFQALVAFKETFSPNTFPTWWGASADCCSWGNITGCKDGRVTSLTFTSVFNDYVAPLDLHGTLPPSLGDLSALTGIDIYMQPNLHGPIPYNWSKLKNLETVAIYSTNVSGPVPSFLSQLTSLQELHLDYCNLSGALPPSLGDLANLNKVSFTHNKLTGTIPSTLFSRLDKGILHADLDLVDNQLTGAIPKSFGRVPFRYISLQDNQLSGDASFLFGKSKPSLVQVTLARNKLSFDLTNVEYPVKNVQYIDLGNNEIYGSINEQIIQVVQEIHLDVRSNHLCGKIPRGGKFTPKDANWFADNKCLCGEPLPPCK
ncbi:polygalacturonase inhibitor-like [Iris pallida]|uniref:Polygalacturonase inhibitor-like n=1 Tax=Iris pallida TaxID=29817 RepID=A0AAX6GVK4_IRIPA|nr:polygalacturonase inhibitor-like [Iris pallida]